MQMTDIIIKALTAPGRYTDDQTKGLHLWVKDNGRKYWNLRYTYNGSRKGIALGAYPEVSLKQARIRAVEQRNLINNGADPMAIKRAQKTPALAPKSAKEISEFIWSFIITITLSALSSLVTVANIFCINLIASDPLYESFFFSLSKEEVNAIATCTLPLIAMRSEF